MRAICVRQPWAWLLVNGWKNIENRSRRTAVRGRILIHAASACRYDEARACAVFVRSFAPQVADIIPHMTSLQFGGIVGEVTILDCVTAHPSEWFCGRYGYVCADARPLPFFSCAGMPSIPFEVDYPYPLLPTALSAIPNPLSAISPGM